MNPLNIPTSARMREARERLDSLYDDLPRYEPIGETRCETCAAWIRFGKADAAVLRRLLKSCGVGHDEATEAAARFCTDWGVCDRSDWSGVLTSWDEEGVETDEGARCTLYEEAK